MTTAFREPTKKVRDALVHGCFERGLLTLGCGRCAVRCMPPLVLLQNLADEALKISGCAGGGEEISVTLKTSEVSETSEVLFLSGIDGQ